AAVALFLGPIDDLAGTRAPLHIPLPLAVLLFFAGESMVVHLQLRRDAYSYSLTEVAMIICLFFADPATVVLGQSLGSTAALTVVRRQSILKLVFNVAHYCFEACLAVLLFDAFVWGSSPLDPLTWMKVVVSVSLTSTVSTLTVALAIGMSGSDVDLKATMRGLAYGLVLMMTNVSLALLGVNILWIKPGAAMLLAIPTAVLFVSYRAYIAQREKRESVELLYESSRSVQRSSSSEQAIMTLLSQARQMFRAEVAQLTLFSEDEENLAWRSSLGPDDLVGVMEPVKLDPKEGVWARVASEGQAILIPRPIQNDRLRVHFAARNVFKDAMVAPIFGREGVMGTVLVGDRLGEVSTFDTEDLKLFETLANHASVSLENARLVDRLKESLAHLTEMNRLKDDFVAAVSHELRTPLTSIQGYVKTLLRPEMRDYDPEARHSFLEAVDRQSERLRSLIEDLLVVARLDAHEVTPTWTPVRIPDVVDRVLVELRDRTASHTLVPQLPELPTISSDEGKIQQIITNLIDNACKYTPEGTTVTVAAQTEGEGVTVSVIDQGEGIPADQHEKIFDRFYQVDQSSTRQVGGTGLGLYLCRRLADALGGRIWLERSDANGSVFSLWVPLSAPTRSTTDLEPQMGPVAPLMP
ncbi:MAG: ATP-binding protein, partial [Actinomycetota bacterium]